MLGTLNRDSKEVTVVGAGVAGLIAATYLDRLGYTVTVYEKSNRIGGLIQTLQTPHGPAETAAHSLQATPAVTALFKDIGCELVPVKETSRDKFIFRNGQLRKMPISKIALSRAALKILSLRFKSRWMSIPSRMELAALNVEEFGNRFLGGDVTRYLLDPFVTGIYGAKPNELRLEAAFPRVARFAGLLPPSPNQRHEKGPRPQMAAPRFGMGSFVDALGRHLKHRLGTRFKLSQNVNSIPECPNLLICTPASAAGELIGGADPDLAQQLQKIRYAPLVTATVFLSNDALIKRPQGVGVLFPSSEKMETLGILFNSSAFPERVRVTDAFSSLTVMLGGTQHPDCASWSDREIKTRVHSDLNKVFGIHKPPIHIEITRWNQAIPVYSDFLFETWKLARASWCSTPGRILFGNYTGQVSLRGMIESARELR